MTDLDLSNLDLLDFNVKQSSFQQIQAKKLETCNKFFLQKG